MRIRPKQPRQRTVSFKVTQRHRNLIVCLAAELSVKRGEHITMTDVIEEALDFFARHCRDGKKDEEER